jgi:hypothetical protein
MPSRSVIDTSGSRNSIDDSRSIIDDSRCVIDDSRVMLYLVASITKVIKYRHIFIVQATGAIVKKLL